MATILEALQNAKYNLVDAPNIFSAGFGREQLNNAVTLLEKGYHLEDDVDDILRQYKDLDMVPEKNESDEITI